PCSGSGTPVAIPADPLLTGHAPPIVQLAGSLTAYNVTGTPTFGVYSGTTKRQITLTFTAATSTVVLAYGEHLARDNDWGTNKGASQFSGGSGKAYSQLVAPGAATESGENNAGLNPSLSGGAVSGIKYL